MHYSVHDALQAGFGKMVMVIRKEYQRDFEIKLLTLKKQHEIVFAFQEVNPKFRTIQNIAFREKPWGTVHAVLSAAALIREPFAVINADDFYGRGAFALMYDFLLNRCSENHWAMVGYALKNTLSAHGGVSRGVCEVDDKGLLKNVKECRSVQKSGDDFFYKEWSKKIFLNGNSAVSMNFWGFHPHFFELAEKEFRKFLAENASNPKAEMTLPDLLQPLIKTGTVSVFVLSTYEQWLGMTFKEDKENVRQQLRQLTGIYPGKSE